MDNIIDKLKSIILGTNDFDEDDAMEDGSEEAVDSYRHREKDRDRDREKDGDITDINSVRSRRLASASSTGSKVVNFQTNVQLHVALTSPKNLQDATLLCDYIKENKACVVNLEGVDNAVSQRIADFLSGATYSLGGEIQRVSNEIFIMAPMNVQITGELKDELKAKGVFPWIAGMSASYK